MSRLGRAAIGLLAGAAWGAALGPSLLAVLVFLGRTVSWFPKGGYVPNAWVLPMVAGGLLGGLMAARGPRPKLDWLFAMAIVVAVGYAHSAGAACLHRRLDLVAKLFLDPPPIMVLFWGIVPKALLLWLPLWPVAAWVERRSGELGEDRGTPRSAPGPSRSEDGTWDLG
jgi:hypothetical protein